MSCICLVSIAASTFGWSVLPAVVACRRSRSGRRRTAELGGGPAAASRSQLLVVSEHTHKPGPAHHRPDDSRACFGVFASAQHPVPHPLMRLLSVVVLHVLAGQMIEMLASERHEMVQALTLEQPNPAFGEGAMPQFPGETNP